ncbi:MAG: acetyl-CoA carboxylase biotin carboxylase subunit, partial [Armatimonadetes bacterium]|nr:acetyl-CoA carboxylase biotin carboxylase subunit [Armatimonadota bacterium]
MTPFQRIAIANRGEIAVRVIRACRDLGATSLLLCSEVDRDSLGARLADEVWVMRGMAPRDAYLDVSRMVARAVEAGADALHPGYGFLSENPALARACEAAGIVFVGPHADHIVALGDKNEARRTMAGHGVPVVPGTDGPVKDVDEALSEARRIGFPLLLKASKGGGGRGMRKVHSESDLPQALSSAQSEARAAFGSPDVYLEKYLERPRHVEVQIAADAQGNAVHLFERECSIQRRFQKMIEEAPSPFLDEETRAKMGAAAVAGARGIGYRTLCTFEFLVDAQRNFYFLEVNTRLQVEHPVTEEITGVDLVRLQILLAAGQPLPFSQEQLDHRGWAFEARITCEDPFADFVPQPGLISRVEFPQGPGIRVDGAIFNGAVIPPFYDSLAAKLIVRGATREEARERMLRALSEMQVEGVRTTIPFHQWVFANDAFTRGDMSTHFLDEQGWGREGKRIEAPPAAREMAAALAAIHAHGTDGV